MAATRPRPRRRLNAAALAPAEVSPAEHQRCAGSGAAGCTAAAAPVPRTPEVLKRSQRARWKHGPIQPVSEGSDPQGTRREPQGERKAEAGVGNRRRANLRDHAHTSPVSAAIAKAGRMTASGTGCPVRWGPEARRTPRLPIGEAFGRQRLWPYSFATAKSHRSRRIAPPRAASINLLYSGRKWTWTRLRVQAASDMITFPFTASVIG